MCVLRTYQRKNSLFCFLCAYFPLIVVILLASILLESILFDGIFLVVVNFYPQLLVVCGFLVNLWLAVFILF